MKQLTVQYVLIFLVSWTFSLGALGTPSTPLLRDLNRPTSLPPPDLIGLLNLPYSMLAGGPRRIGMSWPIGSNGNKPRVRRQLPDCIG